MSCWLEPVLQNWGIFGGFRGWGGYAGGLCPSSPGWCGAAPCSSCVGASLGSGEPRALLQPNAASWPSSLGSGLHWVPCAGWEGSDWCCAAGRRAQSARLGPSPPRLLTEEEYRIQGEVETRKALEELRNYCRSPDFSAWTAVSRIQSPKR